MYFLYHEMLYSIYYKILPLSNISADIYFSIHNKFQSHLSDRKIPLLLEISNLRISNTARRGRQHLHVGFWKLSISSGGIKLVRRKCVSSFRNISYMHGIAWVTKKWNRGKGKYISMFNEMKCATLQEVPMQ